MAINTSKSGLQNLLTSLLAAANQSQNLFLPPSIFSTFVNIVTSFLIDKCVEGYPLSPQLIDIIDPFVKIDCLTPSGGLITLPSDYRNMLGSPSIIVKNDKVGECGDIEIPITNAQQFLNATLKGGCNRRPITIVAQSEFDYLTTSSYKKPNFWEPIGFFTGQKQIRVCPTDLSKIFVLYVQKEAVYSISYQMNPDDSWYIDPTTTIDTAWNNSAFTALFRGLNHLYGIYSRDKQFSDWAAALSNINIL